MTLRTLAREIRDFPATVVFSLIWIVVFVAMVAVRMQDDPSPTWWRLLLLGLPILVGLLLDALIPLLRRRIRCNEQNKPRTDSATTQQQAASPDQAEEEQKGARGTSFGFAIRHEDIVLTSASRHVDVCCAVTGVILSVSRHSRREQVELPCPAF